MTTLTETAVDFDVLNAHDFEPCCDYGKSRQLPPCDSPAEWFVVTACCGCSGTRCAPHLEQIRKAMELRGIICAFCGALFNPGALAERYTRVVRL